MKKHTDKQEKRTMKTNYLLIALVLFASLPLGGCGSRPGVGQLQTESQSVELGDAKSVHVEINLGAGELKMTGGAEKLLEADFTYNVAKLKPEVEYTDGTLVIWQPESKGLPDFRGITDFRNEWGLRLNDAVPIDLSVNMGAGASDLQLAGLSLTGLDITMGAGKYNVNLSGDWARDLDVRIDAGAADLTVRLPRDVGVRVEVDRGPTMIDAQGLAQDGHIYTNAAYGVSEVTLQVDMQSGIGQIRLELED
jgi:predicted small secreted protein